MKTAQDALSWVLSAKPGTRNRDVVTEATNGIDATLGAVVQALDAAGIVTAAWSRGFDKYTWHITRTKRTAGRSALAALLKDAEAELKDRAHVSRAEKKEGEVA